jgi:hypothetical protein
VEYQQAITKYADVDAAYPARESFVQEGVYINACKIHELRMDRLLKARKECFDRYERAAEIYRVALLTRDGQEVLLSLATKARPGVRTREYTAPPMSSLPSSNSESSGVEVLTEDRGDGGVSSQSVQVFIKVR